MQRTLNRALAESATRYAHRAVERYVQSAFEDFYLDAGIAIEHAMKSRLARENAAFLAPDRGFKSALALWKTREDVTALPVGTRTIGAAEASTRVRELVPEFARHADAVAQILAFRNGEAHLGAPGSVDHRAVLTSFIRAMNQLLLVPPEGFWSTHAAFVTAILDETATETARDIAERIAAARAAHKSKLDGLNVDERHVLIEHAIEERDRQTWQDALEWPCPACDGPAILHGDNAVEWDVEYGPDGVAEGTPFIEFRAFTLHCELCDLELNDPDELEAAGIEVTFHNEAADLDTYMREYSEGY